MLLPFAEFEFIFKAGVREIKGVEELTFSHIGFAFFKLFLPLRKLACIVSLCSRQREVVAASQILDWGLLAEIVSSAREHVQFVVVVDQIPCLSPLFLGRCARRLFSERTLFQDVQVDRELCLFGPFDQFFGGRVIVSEHRRPRAIREGLGTFGIALTSRDTLVFGKD